MAALRFKTSPAPWGALALVAVLLCGCNPPPAPAQSPAPGGAAAPAGFPLTITDDSGRQVTLPAPPQRILCLSPGHTETLYALGVGDRVVLTDTYSDYPAAVKPKAKLNCWPQPPVEQIVAERPDLVVLLTVDDSFLKKMDGLSIPTVKLFPETYARALEEIELLGRLTGTEPAAQKLVAEMRTREEKVRSRLQGVTPKKVLYEMSLGDAGRFYVAGRGGFYGTLLAAAGGINLFDDLEESAVQVSGEQVVARNPDVVLLGDTDTPIQPQQPGMLKQRPGWAETRAVRTGQVFPVKSERITRPGPRLVEGLEEIARLLHPERFQ